MVQKFLQRVRYFRWWHTHKFNKFHGTYYTIDERGVKEPCYEVCKCRCRELEYPPGPHRRISIFKMMVHLEDDPQNDNRWLIAKTVRSGRIHEAIRLLP